jgi:hypothetical protein
MTEGQFLKIINKVFFVKETAGLLIRQLFKIPVFLKCQ